jgi:hypothetical protein
LRHVPIFLCALLGPLVAGSLAVAQQQPPAKPTEEQRNGQRAHLEAQIPAKADFDRLMMRDLVAYFSKAGEPPATVHYELLRTGPTLAGVSSPKYYAWVTVGDAAAPTSRGAVRMAAKDGERFDVMEFFTAEQIRKDPAPLESVFPKSVIVKIQEKAREAEPPSSGAGGV